MKTFTYTLLGVFCMFTSTLYGATYGGGSGTADDPYQIWTAQQFNTIGADPNDWDNSFVLMADINLSGFVGTQYKIIGNATTPFSGTFDGNNRKISNLTYTTTEEVDNLGLFGNTANTAIIQDLGMVDVALTSGGNSIGPLAGSNKGIISNCYATGSVEGAYSVGGLVGDNYDGSITACYAACSVKGTSSVGGLAGSNTGPLILCYATGTVDGDYAGGLVGYNASTVSYKCALTACYATGTVTGKDVAGGLTGYNDNGMLTTCYAANKVTGNYYVGGLVGQNLDHIHTAPDEDPFAAEDPKAYLITACLWDTSVSGVNLGVGNISTNSSGVIGKTTALMKTLATYTDEGWDFTNETANGTYDYWQMDDDSYPEVTVVTWTLTGEGTSEKPYIIATSADLGKIWQKPSASYRLGGNLDLTGISWLFAVIPVFTGNFDGQGYAISNLTIDQPASLESIGFFGVVDGGKIEKLDLKNVKMTGVACVGGLAGENSGTIDNCSVTGLVTGTGEDFFGFGGLAGINNGAITNCCSTASIAGTDEVGGLAGQNNSEGTIDTCFAAGSIKGTTDVGGIVGGNYAGKITDCFWDTQVTGTTDGVGNVHPDPAGAVGKTTVEMKTRATFTDAGWDFFGETANGTKDYWEMPTGGYPILYRVRELPAKAANPRPANLASNVRTTAQLKWSSSKYASSHDIYFGTDPSLDPNTSFQKNQTVVGYNPGRLEVSTTYYWRIDERNTNGVTTGKVWSFTTADLPFTVQKGTFTALKTPGLGNISISGFFDAMDDDFTAATEISVILDAEDLAEPNNCIWTFPIHATTYKKGKFSCTNKGVSVSTLKIDSLTSKMTFTAKKVDLTGLSCPMTVTVTLGDYSESYELNEAIVNGKKPCPIPFMMGVKDTLSVTKYKVKHGKKPNTDSFTASGTFTLADDYNKANPLVITLGTETFTVPGGLFANKKSIESCKKALSTEGPMVDAKFDFVKCTYTISVKNAFINQHGTVDFAVNCFGVNLEGFASVIIP